jgi:hypothetical protein
LPSRGEAEASDGADRGADTVELKLTIPETTRAKTSAALGVDPLDTQVRQVFFFDTPELALNAAGVVVRARRRQGEDGDTVVKLRPVEPADLPEDLRRNPAFGVEVDAMPGGYVCSASFKGVASNDQIREAATGKRPIRKLFSKAQRAFFSAHAPDGTDLDASGPRTDPDVPDQFKPQGSKRKFVGEMWLYPDASQIVELSTKTTPAEALDVAAECRALLESRGVNLSAEQQTKTTTALEFFATPAAG